jgi:uncharacterized protein (TIGR04255 family)
MSLEHLQPFAGEHAVQSAALALDFASELDVGEVSRIRAAAEELKGDLPLFTEQRRTTVQVDAGATGAVAPATTHDVGGFIMQKPSPGSGLPGGAPAFRSVVVARENVVIAVNDYTRWAKFRADVERYLSVLLRPINAQKGVVSVGLQMADVFLWKSDPADLPLNEILNSESPFLAKHVFEPGLRLWHSHHGYLIDQTAPVRHTMLENVNVSRNDASGTHHIQVITSHKVTFERPVFKVLDATKDRVFGIVDGLHASNKAILRSVLTAPLQEKISLNGRKEH